MVNISESIHVTAKPFVNEAMGAQADEACAGGNRRNGYRERRFLICVGEMALRIPRPWFGSYYPENLLGR